jgi:hypothetical protein
MLCMSGLLAACAPTLEVTVENFVLPNSSERLLIYRSPCGIPRAKCGGGGAISISGRKKFLESFTIEANPVYLNIQGIAKLRFIIRKNGKICADKTIITKEVIINNVEQGEEHAIRCEEK